MFAADTFQYDVQTTRFIGMFFAFYAGQKQVGVFSQANLKMT